MNALITWSVQYCTDAVTEAEYLALMGKLWGVFYEDFR